MRKLLLAAAIGSIAVAVPAVATATGGTGTGPKCTVKHYSYTAGGKIVKGGWNLTKNSNGTYSGTLTIHVNHQNYHAKLDHNGDITYTVTDAHVTFSKHLKAPYDGDHVVVTGTINYRSKACHSPGFTAPKITKITVSPPAHHSS